MWDDMLRATLFQSTLPVGGATQSLLPAGGIAGFQSTLPVGGATAMIEGEFKDLFDFNPRSPWGERQDLDAAQAAALVFQSTLPVGGATSRPGPAVCLNYYFNPRSPWGERPAA